MKQDDKPFWGPVAALMARVGWPFAAWPFSPAAPVRPITVANGPQSANDDSFFLPPGVA